MSFVIGILPAEETQYKIRSSLAEVGKIFETQDIPITYVDRDSYHVTLLFLGQKMSFLRKKRMDYQLKNYSKNSFVVTVNNVRLGISRERKDLVFLPVIEGADEMRGMVYELSGRLNLKRNRKFIPHFTLGRVRKDLTEEEYRNLTNAVSTLNQSGSLQEIRFGIDRFSLIEFQQGKATELKQFPM